MVKLNPRNVDYMNHNTPVLYDYEIDAYAHAVLEDYKPLLLEEPGTLNFQHFLESYLGASKNIMIYTTTTPNDLF